MTDTTEEAIGRVLAAMRELQVRAYRAGRLAGSDRSNKVREDRVTEAEIAAEREVRRAVLAGQIEVAWRASLYPSPSTMRAIRDDLQAQRAALEVGE